jgi:hypothetical protein
MIRLNRVKLFVLGLVVIVTCYFIRQVTFIVTSHCAEGKVVAVTNANNTRTRISYPVVEFSVDGREYAFTGESNMDVEKGDRVEVIYKTDDPTDAHIYTFAGFWLRNIIWFIVPLLLWAAFSTSYLDKGELLTLNLRAHSESRRGLPQDWRDQKRLEK